MEHLRNYTDREEPKQLERNLSKWHFVHHIAHMNWRVAKPGPSRREDYDKRSEIKHDITHVYFMLYSQFYCVLYSYIYIFDILPYALLHRAIVEAVNRIAQDVSNPG
jgi:hypothetical protein